MKKSLYLIAAAFCAASCVYPFKTELISDASHTLVVDGNIMVGGTSTIQLSYVLPLERNAAEKVRGYAWIEDDKGNRYYPEGSASQRSDLLYIPTDSPQAMRASSFRAVVEADGETYTSEWTTPKAAPRLVNLHFDADEQDVIVLADLETGQENLEYIGFLYEETWEFHADFVCEFDIFPEQFWLIEERKEPYPYYWCYKTNDPKQIMLADISHMAAGSIKDVPVIRFPRGDKRNLRKYSILVKAFALTDEAYRYNKQLQEVSDQGGDLFTPDPGYVEGNLECISNPEKEVMGLVLSARVSTRRAFLDSRYSQYRTPYEGYLGEVRWDDYPEFYYGMNYRPVKMVHSDLGDYLGWGPIRCFDCIADGGTQEKPDFWED